MTSKTQCTWWASAIVRRTEVLWMCWCGGHQRVYSLHSHSITAQHITSHLSTPQHKHVSSDPIFSNCQTGNLNQCMYWLSHVCVLRIRITNGLTETKCALHGPADKTCKNIHVDLRLRVHVYVCHFGCTSHSVQFSGDFRFLRRNFNVKF